MNASNLQEKFLRTFLLVKKKMFEIISVFKIKQTFSKKKNALATKI